MNNNKLDKIQLNFNNCVVDSHYNDKYKLQQIKVYKSFSKRLNSSQQIAIKLLSASNQPIDKFKTCYVLVDLAPVCMQATSLWKTAFNNPKSTEKIQLIGL